MTIQKTLAMLAIASVVCAPPIYEDVPIYPLRIRNDDDNIINGSVQDYVGPIGKPKPSNRKRLRKLSQKSRRRNRKSK